MIKLGLDNEEVIWDNTVGDTLLAITDDGVSTPVVTFVYGSSWLNFNQRVLYTVISTCYDGNVFAGLEKERWLGHFFTSMGRRDFNLPYLRDSTHELLGAQAMAFDQIKKLQGGHHDKHSTPGSARFQQTS